MLNAHMDTYSAINPAREILKEDNIWTSSSGILGADDRAGVTILLDLAERMAASKRFNGTIKYCFAVAEECGLIGASQVAQAFLLDVNAAIVFDRRHTSDIVDSCQDLIRFCDRAYSRVFERAAKQLGLKDWKCTAGGYSDTVIWAESGIQSVNLSVGYKHEHTSAESLNVIATKETSNLAYYMLHSNIYIQTINTLKS